MWPISTLSCRDWDHLCRRSDHGQERLHYEPIDWRIVAAPINAIENVHTSNLDNLMKFSECWIHEFKSEHRNKQKKLRQLISAGRLAHISHDIDAELQLYLNRLVDEKSRDLPISGLCAMRSARLC